MEWDKHYKNHSFSCTTISLSEQGSYAGKISIFILSLLFCLIVSGLYIFVYFENEYRIGAYFLAAIGVLFAYSLYIYAPLTRFIYKQITPPLFHFRFFQKGIAAQMAGEKRIKKEGEMQEIKNIHFSYEEIQKIRVKELPPFSFDKRDEYKRFEIEWILENRSYVLFFDFLLAGDLEVFRARFFQLYDKGIEIVEEDAEGNQMYLLQKQGEKLDQKYWDLIAEIGKPMEE